MRELTALRGLPAASVPVPYPAWDTHRLLLEMSSNDDKKAFLGMFEQKARHEGWTRDVCSRLIVPLMTGEAQQAYYVLPTEEADYLILCNEILAHCGLSPSCATASFHSCTYQCRKEPWAQVDKLLCIADCFS